jgi:hypothetical protein
MRSVLYEQGREPEVFLEGRPDAAAKERLDRIRQSLEDGYLSDRIKNSSNADAAAGLTPDHVQLLSSLVDSVTSEVGRALVALTVLQLCIKAIAPEQSIRLHKAGGGGSHFSWVSGVPMRVLDKNFVTPALRHHGLLKLNADGFMMTRSLAENYPYSSLYKAAMRGGRAEWLELVDLIELQVMPAEPALACLLGLLQNRTVRFQQLASAAMKELRLIAEKTTGLESATSFIKSFVDESPYSARVFEIAIHALFQVLQEKNVFEGVLKPLCQMRSANKKHGNIGDIEIVRKQGGLEILESWDAKYGKPYLRDELDEVSEKLDDHSETAVVGFVTDCQPSLKREIIARCQEIHELHQVDVFIQSFEEWVKCQAGRIAGPHQKSIPSDWIIAFGESLCQMRRDLAPIDEPSDSWVESLADFARQWGN